MGLARKRWPAEAIEEEAMDSLANIALLILLTAAADDDDCVRCSSSDLQVYIASKFTVSMK